MSDIIMQVLSQALGGLTDAQKAEFVSQALEAKKEETEVASDLLTRLDGLIEQLEDINEHLDIFGPAIVAWAESGRTGVASLHDCINERIEEINRENKRNGVAEDGEVEGEEEMDGDGPVMDIPPRSHN
jgi:hypothetical protein